MTAKHTGRLSRGSEKELERALLMDERIHGGGDLMRANYIALDVPTLFWIFVVVSIGGLIGETLVSYPIDGIIKNRAGLLWGPFSPLYGLAGVLFSLVLNPHWKDSMAVQFVVGACVGGLTEGLAGFLLKNLFGIVAWSYASHPFNFWTYTSVPMMCVWGAVGLFWFRIVLPTVYRGMKRVESNLKPRLLQIVTVTFMVYMALNIAMTLTGFTCWMDRLAGEAPDTPIEQFFAEHYDNDYMDAQFGALSVFPEIAQRY